MGTQKALPAKVLPHTKHIQIAGYSYVQTQTINYNR